MEQEIEREYGEFITKEVIEDAKKTIDTLFCKYVLALDLIRRGTLRIYVKPEIHRAIEIGVDLHCRNGTILSNVKLIPERDLIETRLAIVVEDIWRQLVVTKLV